MPKQTRKQARRQHGDSSVKSSTPIACDSTTRGRVGTRRTPSAGQVTNTISLVRADRFNDSASAWTANVANEIEYLESSQQAYRAVIEQELRAQIRKEFKLANRLTPANAMTRFERRRFIRNVRVTMVPLLMSNGGNGYQTSLKCSIYQKRISWE